ncbi:hypothetical protein [Streptomyces sp. NPDC093589]|uniref:hypothetical protein n=1 Tax=Streptomyces sp. NPDC093589 TaxID=3366043 RepID=UPI003819CA72
MWPTLEEAFGDYAVRMNTIPKHVASRTLTEVKWNATLLGDDVVGLTYVPTTRWHHPRTLPEAPRSGRTGLNDE